jgi:protein phosphatase
VAGSAANGAQQAVHDFAVSDTARANTGTTLTAMLWSGAQFALAHVGDTRAYLLRGGELTQITHDHTFVQSLVDEGRLTPEEAAAHPKRAELLRALNQGAGQVPDLHLREAHDGDRYLLTTDGVHGVVGERRLRETLHAATDPDAAADDLARLVNDAGAPDNFACIVIDARAAA